MKRHPNHGIVHEAIRRPRRSVVEGFAAHPSSIVADALGGSGVLDPGIRPVDAGMRVCGPALTVTTRPGDLLFVLKATDVVRPGDVLVVDGGGRLDGALLGEILAGVLQREGCAGVVIDGVVRDGAELVQMGFPVFSRGTYPAARGAEGPGAINVPVQCGGAIVRPGDIVIGDADGAVVVPREDAPAVLDEANATVAREEAWRARLTNGTPMSQLMELDAKVAAWRCESPTGPPA